MIATPQLHPLSIERHGHRFWRRVSSYDFTAHQPLLPLAGMELIQAAQALPIAFVQLEGGFHCVAVVGTRLGECLFVGDAGRWEAAYVPAVLACHPFSLARQDAEKLIACIDEASGLMSDSPQDEPIFHDGKLTAATQRVFEFLNQIHTSHVATRRACEAMHVHGLLKPWDITLENTPGSLTKVKGLFCVDEAALNALPDGAFLELRRCGALVLAYAQLLARQHIQKLFKLAAVKARHDADKAAVSQMLAQGSTLNLAFLEGDKLRFH